MTELKDLSTEVVFPWVHPEKVASLMGCSVRTIRRGFDDGSIPFVTPFANGDDAKRPTRYVDVQKWKEQVVGDA